MQRSRQELIGCSLVVSVVYHQGSPFLKVVYKMPVWAGSRAIGYLAGEQGGLQTNVGRRRELYT